MTNVECLMTKEWQIQNDEKRPRAASFFGRSGFPRHSSFGLRHFSEIISTHSTAAPHWSSSRADYQSIFPSLREAEALPSFCATLARVPIHRDDKATPRASSLKAADESPDKVAFPATPDRDAIPYCRCP